MENYLSIDSIKTPLLNSTELLFAALKHGELIELYEVLVRYIQTNDLREMNKKRMTDALIEPLDKINIIPVISAVSLKFAIHVDVDFTIELLASRLIPDPNQRRERFALPNEIKSILSSDPVLLYLTVLILYLDVVAVQLNTLLRGKPVNVRS